MDAMNTDTGGKIVRNGTGGRYATIDEFQGDGDGMGMRVQVKASQDGGVKEAVRSTRVDQRVDGDGRLAGWADVNEEGEVAR